MRGGDGEFGLLLLFGFFDLGGVRRHAGCNFVMGRMTRQARGSLIRICRIFSSLMAVGDFECSTEDKTRSVTVHASPRSKRLLIKRSSVKQAYYYCVSSTEAFSRSSVTSAAASFSCASSVSADAVPLTEWLAVAGFLA